MKAWHIYDVNDNEYSIVVYADTASRAKAIGHSDGLLYDAEYINLRANRIKSMDDLYRYEYVMDWDKDVDRLALVKAGWHCEYTDADWCHKCTAKEFCSIYDPDL